MAGKNAKQKAAELKKAENEKRVKAEELKKARALVKAADEEDEGEGDDPEEDDDKIPENLKKKNAAKANNKSAAEEIDKDDLEKSLGELEEMASDGDTDARKDVLLEKAKGSDGLTKAETDELYDILGGEPKEEVPLADGISKGLKDNEGVTQALDVSEYLQEQHTELCKSLDGLSEHVEKGDNRQHQFNLILAKAVSETGRLVKSVADRIGVVEAQPARAPKAKRTPADPAQKGFGGQPPEGEELTKTNVLDALEEMIVKSVNAGNGGHMGGGIDLSVEAAKFEASGMLNPSVVREVKLHIAEKAKGGTVH